MLTFSLLFLVSTTWAGHLARHHNGENHTVIRTDTSLPPVGEARPIDLNYLQAFRGFSVDLIKQSYYYQSLVKSGAVCYCPFTLGFLLAAVNQRTFDVPTDGIVKALKLSPENVTNAYAGIADSFLEDVKVKASSFLYTQNQAVQLGPEYKRLHTEKVTLQLDGNSHAASRYINGQIAKCTRNAIVNRLLPNEPQFNNQTAGVFVNTLYYKSGWDTTLVSIGKQQYHVEPNEIKSVDTLEANGRLRVLQTAHYDAVSLPLLGGRKRVVLVLPKGISLQEYIQNYSQEVFQSCPRDWSRRQAKVQFPALKLILGRNFEAQLNELSESKTQCNKDSGKSSYIQPVVQVGSYKLCSKGFELAITNGVQVNGIESEPVKLKAADVEVEKAAKTETEPVKAAKQILDDDEDITEEPEPEDLPPISLLFYKPFFLYLHDNTLGAVSFAAVQSLFNSSTESESLSPIRIYREFEVPKTYQLPADAEDAREFSELVKLKRWSCSAAQ